MKDADAAKYSLCAYLRGVVVALIQLGRVSLNPRRLVLKVGGASTFQAGMPGKLKSPYFKVPSSYLVM